MVAIHACTQWQFIGWNHCDSIVYLCNLTVLGDSHIVNIHPGQKFSVSSDVNLPPELLIAASRLKLLETIGQGLWIPRVCRV